MVRLGRRRAECAWARHVGPPGSSTLPLPLPASSASHTPDGAGTCCPAANKRRPEDAHLIGPSPAEMLVRLGRCGALLFGWLRKLTVSPSCKPGMTGPCVSGKMFGPPPFAAVAEANWPPPAYEEPERRPFSHQPPACRGHGRLLWSASVANLPGEGCAGLRPKSSVNFRLKNSAPLVPLGWRCNECHSVRIDAMVMSKDSQIVPW
jgi:hypothetical protein